jgi:hypothetical protein
MEEYNYVPVENSYKNTFKEKGYLLQVEFHQKAFNIWDVLVEVLPENEHIITIDDNKANR